MSRPPTFFVSLLFICVLTLGVLGAPAPLMRVACALALAAIGAALGIRRRAAPRLLTLLTRWTWLFIVVGFAATLSITSYLGGDAINGRSANDRYFLAEESGPATEVSRLQYYGVAAIELSLFASLPLGLTLAKFDQWGLIRGRRLRRAG